MKKLYFLFSLFILTLGTNAQLYQTYDTDIIAEYDSNGVMFYHENVISSFTLTDTAVILHAPSIELDYVQFPVIKIEVADVAVFFSCRNVLTGNDTAYFAFNQKGCTLSIYLAGLDTNYYGMLKYNTPIYNIDDQWTMEQFRFSSGSNAFYVTTSLDGTFSNSYVTDTTLNVCIFVEECDGKLATSIKLLEYGLYTTTHTKTTLYVVRVKLDDASVVTMELPIYIFFERKPSNL